MNKRDFLAQLRRGLAGLPELEERLTFYDEMINDRMEEGMTEEDAVAAVGTVDAVMDEILAETSFTKLAKHRITKRRRLKTWELVLLIAGSPLWLALVVVMVAVIVSLYVSAWSVVISCWAVGASCAACAIAGVVMGAVYMISGNVWGGIALVGAALVCAGLAIVLFFGYRALTRGMVWLTKAMVLRTKRCFAAKEEAV